MAVELREPLSHSGRAFQRLNISAVSNAENECIAQAYKDYSANIWPTHQKVTRLGGLNVQWRSWGDASNGLIKDFPQDPTHYMRSNKLGNFAAIDPGFNSTTLPGISYNGEAKLYFNTLNAKDNSAYRTNNGNFGNQLRSRDGIY